MKRSNVYTMTYIAVCAALMAVCAWISIPTPWNVAYTLQTFAIFFAVSFLGGKYGTIATTIYVLIGAVGVPVFSGFKGGIGALMGTTGGYIIGFIFTCLFLWATEKIWNRKKAEKGNAKAAVINIAIKAAFFVIGLLICYAFGTVWFMQVYAKSHDAAGIATVLGWCVIPYIIPDIVKIALAIFVSDAVKKALPRQ